MKPTKDQILENTAYVLDDSLNEHSIAELTGEKLESAIFVVYQCGFEPMAVAVVSYMPNVKITEEEAEEIAKDFLIEKNWFSGEPRDADYFV